MKWEMANAAERKIFVIISFLFFGLNTLFLPIPGKYYDKMRCAQWHPIYYHFVFLQRNNKITSAGVSLSKFILLYKEDNLFYIFYKSYFFVLKMIIYVIICVYSVWFIVRALVLWDLLLLIRGSARLQE